MKRNGQMQRAGVPAAGTREGFGKKMGFKGWKKDWRVGERLIDLRSMGKLSQVELKHCLRNGLGKSGYKYQFII